MQAPSTGRRTGETGRGAHAAGLTRCKIVADVACSTDGGIVAGDTAGGALETGVGGQVVADQVVACDAEGAVGG